MINLFKNIQKTDYNRSVKCAEKHEPLVFKNNADGIAVGIALNGQTVLHTNDDNKRNRERNLIGINRNRSRIDAPKRIEHYAQSQRHIHVFIEEILVIIFQHLPCILLAVYDFAAALSETHIE